MAGRSAPPVEEGLPAGAGGVCGGCAGKVNALMGEDIWSLANVTIEDDSHPLYRTVRLKPIFSEKKPHIPGQHISLQCLVGSVFVERSYTLTSDNSSDAYEIIVKKEIRGQMSQRFFSSNLDEFVIRVSEPRGNYFWDKSTQHRVLNLAAGIGVTPALSMARSCAVDTVDYHKVGIHLSINQED
jgi:ferredoxin-NADP reductase